MEDVKEQKQGKIDGEGTMEKPFVPIWGNTIQDFSRSLASEKGGTVRQGNGIYAGFNENIYYIKGNPTAPSLKEKVMVDFVVPEGQQVNSVTARAAVSHAIRLYSAFLPLESRK